MSLITMDRANLYCGLSNNSLHLQLTDMKLPSMSEQYIDHHPGGGVMGIEVDVIFNKLECTFKLLGWDTQVASLVGAWQKAQTQFIAYGMLRDQMTGLSSQAIALIVGRLNADPENFRIGDPMAWAYSIKGIIHYQLNIAGSILYYWDFAQNKLTVGASAQSGLPTFQPDASAFPTR